MSNYTCDPVPDFWRKTRSRWRVQSLCAIFDAIVNTMTDIRQASTTLLANSLRKAADSSATNADDIAKQLEEAVYAKHGGDTGNDYRDQLRSLSLDLGKNNVELARELLEGRINAKDLIESGPDGLKSAERAQQDDEINEQNLRESLGSSKIPVYEHGGAGAGPAAATDLSQEGEVSAQEASMGEEGDMKARSQPKIQGLEGIEFESGL